MHSMQTLNATDYEVLREERYGPAHFYNEPPDFNNIREWLLQKLNERECSLNHFVLKAKYDVTPASIYRWFNDTFRPTPEKMDVVCKTLSRLPLRENGKPIRFEQVPLWEGLSQFTPRP